jgi:hypothetical protein
MIREGRKKELMKGDEERERREDGPRDDFSSCYDSAL